MITQFSEEELDSLEIQFIERPERPAAYLEERERVWTGQMEKVLARGGHMWNGEVYTLEEVAPTYKDRVLLRVSTCEYKDLVFRMLQGEAHIARLYGESHLVRFSGVSCVPMTLDGKYVFGIRADRPEQGAPPIGGIGGTINKDEAEIHNFSDIRQGMLREIQEETALDCPEGALKFFGLFGASNFFVFLFTFRANVLSEHIDQYHRPGEFSRLVALTEQEALTTSLPMSGAFRRWRPYLHVLPAVLEGRAPAIF